MDIDTFKLTLYACGCGYKTIHGGNASKHKKVSCGHEMTNEMTEFVTKKDHLASHGTQITNNNDNRVDNSHNHIGDNIDNSTNITNVTLVLPERTTKEDFLDYLQSLEHLGFRAPEQVATMPAKMLMFTRDAKKLPGSLIERDKKIIEKLPDGTERIMGKKKAIQTYTHEAVDALCLQPPVQFWNDPVKPRRPRVAWKMGNPWRRSRRRSPRGGSDGTVSCGPSAHWPLWRW